MSSRNGYQKISESYGNQKFTKELELYLEKHGSAFVWSVAGYFIACVILFFTFGGGIKEFFWTAKNIGIGLISNWLPDYLLTVAGNEYKAIDIYEAAKRVGLWTKITRYAAIGVLAIPFGVLTHIIMLRIFRHYAKEAEKLHHLDGAELKTEKEILNRIADLHEEQPARGHLLTLPVGKVSLTRCNEVYGMLIVGAPGSGKTVAICQMLDKLQTMDTYRVIAYTPKGDFISKYFNPKRGDIIVNPFDKRSLNLNIFDFVKQKTDLQRVAAVLIPEQSGSQDPFWTSAARSCLCGILNYCIMTDRKTNAQLWEVLCWSKEKILSDVATCPGSEELEKYYSDGKLASNVSAVVSAYTTIFKYLPKGSSEVFDMKAWLDEYKGGWIFVSNHDELKDILKPWITLFIDFMVSAHLALPESAERRVVYVLDEVNTLHSSVGDTIYKLAITGRSKGAVLLLGAQGCTGLEKTLGKERAAEVYNAVSNSIFLRTGSDPTTAEWMSKVLGETMFYETELSDSYKVGDAADGGSGRKIRKTEALVMPSVFHEMPSLTAYVHLSEYGVCKTIFTPKSRPDMTTGFENRDDLDFVPLKQKAADVFMPLDGDDEVMKMINSI